MPFSHHIIFQVLKVLLIKICKIEPPGPLFIVVFISFYNIIFHKFLELHSTLSEKKIFITNFPLLTDSLKPPNPLNGQKSLSMTKVFVDAP